MSFQVTITLTTYGGNTGPTFDLYTNADNYTTPFATDIDKANLISGYVGTVDSSATVVRCKSKGTCTNYIDMSISGIPGVTPTPTTTQTPTPSPNYTSVSVYSGSSLTIACNNVNLTTVYYTGSITSGLTGTILYSDAGLTNAVPNGYYNPLNGTIWVTAASGNEGRILTYATCPSVTPTPTPTPNSTTYTGIGSYTSSNTITCTPTGNLHAVYLNSTDYATWSSNGNLLAAGMTLFQNGTGTVWSYTRIYDANATTIYSVSSGVITGIYSNC